MSNHRFSHLKSRSESPLSLLCFSHAGGGTARYRAWHERISDLAELIIPHLAGREGRFLEPAFDDIERVSAEIVSHIEPWRARTLIPIGISYGALLAFETALRLESSGFKVDALLVASQRAPHQHANRLNWHTMSEEELVSRLIAFGGIDASILNDPEFCELFLPTIRSDLHASDTYSPMNEAKLRCPVIVWRGQLDEVIREKDIEGWREVSSRVTYRRLPAGHFLLDGEDDLWLADFQQMVPALTARDSAVNTDK